MINHPNRSKVRHFDPTEGQAFQGDVAIIPIPSGISISRHDEISPVDGRLILQEGEVSGHHHAIALRQRNFQSQLALTADPLLSTRDPALKKAFGGMSQAKSGTARMYRDGAAVQAMVSKGILMRTDLAIGCLIVEGAPVLLAHEEHDTIEIPPGQYVIGRQVESAGAEERVVRD
jgi:hypothetical protein